MAGHIYLGDNLDATHLGISHDVAHLLLGVEATIEGASLIIAARTGNRNLQVGCIFLGGTLHAHGILVVVDAPCTTLGEEWIALNLDAPSLVVGEVPVHLVYLVERQHVKQLVDLVDGKEVAGAVERESTVSVPRRILDLARRQTFRRFGKLRKGSQRPDNTKLCGG